MARATGIGSLPGTDVGEALRGVREILGDGHLPYLPELPARGPGADMIGRAAGLLVDLPVDLQPGGWRFVDRPGRDSARTASLWRQDLDQLAEVFDGYGGDLKLQVTGPFTLAAGVELNRGEKSLGDEGAVRDLVGSLAEGVRQHVAEVRRLVPGASVVLQLDEPSLPAVLAGRLPTASGYGHLRAVDPQTAISGLRDVLAAAPEGTATVVHCCDPAIPLPLLRATGVGAVALDVTRLTPMRWESVAATVEEGVALYAGCLPTDGTGTVGSAADLVARGWADAGMPAGGLGALTATPACGLPGLTPEGAWRVQRAAVDVAAEWSERAES
ncbi:Cobalamin-independent synthase, Catalytic domain [Pedococcus dokdonensis]|uniref:Cobalamin-independent synthase, Catalytic domain n=1 Tax=Pedococcus dokdonensis TaxID=443156 RepID=A0A1H0QXY9_9MICO|nr:methionine synthase [Pedococcus dokdonensis]SDP22114.1 Cobalamin-independent synthase, Catalytic domain [Pedococcus dokdonensis]